MPAMAHGFGQTYSLPVPVWLYQYGAASALALSFLLIGWFVTAEGAALNERRVDLSRFKAGRALLHPGVLTLARVLSVLALVLTLAAGFLGRNEAYSNISMTLFWIVFVLAYAYSVALIGNSFVRINPWMVLCEWLERPFPGAFAGRLAWPPWLGCWPALLFYFAFIWFELFGQSRPLSLAWALAGYSALTFAGAALFGREAWFRHGELFAVFFDILGRMAPLFVDGREGQRRLVLRQPFTGLLREPAGSLGLLLFVLFMLSSTAFDGLKSTLPFVRLYWVDLAGWLQLHLGHLSQATLRAWYPWWQTLMLLLSPLLYLAAYLVTIALMRALVRSTLSVRELALRFAYTLVPIAFVYHLTHYYSLVLTQGLQVIALFSDPFGWGWNLFGTARERWWLLPQAGTVWHTQVWVILAGHIVSVYLAHVEALRLFGDRRQAALSQLPMLLLMVGFTVAGLGILALPIKE